MEGYNSGVQLGCVMLWLALRCNVRIMRRNSMCIAITILVTTLQGNCHHITD